MEQNKVILCTDDICPSSIRKCWYFWDKIKSKIPQLKLNAFVIPHRNFKDDEIITSREFKDWYESVKDWVSLHLHGYSHGYPPENTYTYLRQRILIRKGSELLAEINDNDFGYKAPGYHFNKFTLEILEEFGFPFICNLDLVTFLRNKDKQRSPYQLIQSHTNLNKNPDSIEFIYQRLIDDLRDREFVQIMELV